MKLENLAKQMFLDYAYRRTGVYPNWQYLNSKRKLAWMKELTEVFDLCLDHLSKDIKLPPSIGTPAASYEKGFLAGQVNENRRLLLLLESFKDSLDKQKEEFERNHADS